MVNLKAYLIDPKAWVPFFQFGFSTSSGYQTLMYLGVTLDAWLKKKKKRYLGLTRNI